MTPNEVILTALSLAPAPGIADIQLYQAHAGSGLSWRLGNGPSPYWAYNWAGGTVLARYILDHYQILDSRRVLDWGCGSGVVAIAAALESPARVIAMDADPFARAATAINALANGVAVIVSETEPDLSDIDLVLAGDVFYDEAVAKAASDFLSRCVTVGTEVLVGDPGRKWLPHHRLEPLAHYSVPDFGAHGNVAATVYRFLG